MYHQTTPLSTDQLRDAIASCNRQELKVLRLFREHGQLTPSVCWQKFGSNDALLTSIRRSITDLTERGLLRKMGELQEGFYGRPEHVWELANQSAVTDKTTVGAVSNSDQRHHVRSEPAATAELFEMPDKLAGSGTY